MYLVDLYINKLNLQKDPIPLPRVHKVESKVKS